MAQTEEGFMKLLVKEAWRTRTLGHLLRYFVMLMQTRTMLISQTSMNRCIHCTRCIRFANDVAGAPEFGSTGRGNDLQIGTYLERNLDTELSGNVIDLCPVGALTSKPYAFRARPWELKNTETIDVHNAMGSAIRVDSRGLEVMRVLPRLNEDINIEWIDDKTRFACDGLKTQRLTTPLVRKEDKFYPATWEQALAEVRTAFDKMQPKGDEMKVIAGHLVEAESLVALKDLFNSLGSENLTVDSPQGDKPPAHGIDVRSNYVFNSSIKGIHEADVIFIIGTNPRHEAAVLNARIRNRWLNSEVEIAYIGESFDSTFEFEHLGDSAVAVKKSLAGAWGKKLAAAKRPMIIVGSGVTEFEDAKSIYENVGSFVDKNQAVFNTSEWNGYNVLQRVASRGAAYDIGFVPASASISSTTPKFVYLMAADEVTPADIPKDAFVVYQGHHGDQGAQYADVVLPGGAYTEKSGTYVNTEGRTQLTRACTSLPGAARDDWKIIRALSEFLGKPLPFNEMSQLRARMEEIAPSLLIYDIIEKPSKEIAAVGIKAGLVDANKGSKATGGVMKKVIQDFYFTDAIARRYVSSSFQCTMTMANMLFSSSPTMARCSAARQMTPEEASTLAREEYA